MRHGIDTYRLLPERARLRYEGVKSMVCVISEKDVIVRKPHQCFGCLQSIQKGDPANRQVCTDSGEIYSLYMHTYCDSVMYEMLSIYGMDNEELLIEGCVTEYLREIEFDGSPLEYVLREC